LLPERQLRVAAVGAGRGDEAGETLKGWIELQFFAGCLQAGGDGAGIVQVGGEAVVAVALQQLIGTALRFVAVETGKRGEIGLEERAFG
jgi:hypothetical protein